jgi:molybdate/tungstate transport system substrate-binding protein
MWQIATSMTAATQVWIVVVIVVAAGIGGVGFFAGYEYRGSTAAHPGAAANDTLSILAAGTLGPGSVESFFPTLAGDLVNSTPGVTAPAAAQIYEGSLDVTDAVSDHSGVADVAAVADFRLIPSLLEPTFASYEVVFGSTAEVLVYNSSVSGFSGMTSANWGTTLASVITPAAVRAKTVAPFATWNASTDPNGYNEIFSMMLQGQIYGGGNASVYDHFYNSTPSGVPTPNALDTLPEHESSAALDIHSGIVSALITYRSYAIANDLTYVAFNPIVGLGSNTTAALSDYTNTTTMIYSSSLTPTKVVAGPVLFAATVPLDAPNPTLGAEFLSLLISPKASAVLSAGGAFTPISPAWTDRPSSVPSIIAPYVVPLPSWAVDYPA